MIEGLYVTINPDGKIEKYLSTKDGEVLFPELSVADELIELSEQNYISLYLYRGNLLRMINRPDSAPKVMAEAAVLCEKIK